MRLARRTALVLISSASVFSAVATATADTWQVNRHDPGRTGASSGSVPLAAPNVRWKAFVGASPNDGNIRFGVNDAKVLVASIGGRFVAKDAVTQTEMWKTEILGAGSVAGVVDLTGDAVPEVVVQTTEQAHVLNAATGSIVWSSPMPDIETMGAIRILDVDGDGLLDLYLDNGVGAKGGVDLCAAFSFAGGVATKLWSLPMTLSPQSINSGNDSLVDLDQDGAYEVVLPSWDTILMVRASDGTPITTLAPTTLNGHPYPHAAGFGAQLDGVGDLELLVVQPYASAGSQMIPGIAAYDVDVSTGQFTHLWSVDAGAFESDIVVNADIHNDLDGDGVAEVIFSYRSAADGDVWRTRVLSGSTGMTLDELTDARFEGAADLDGAPGDELVVAASNGLQAFAFDGNALAQLGQTLPGMRATTLSDAALRNLGPQHRRLAALDGPMGRTLVVGAPVGTPGPQATVSSFSSLHGFTIVNGAFAPAGSYEPVLGTVTGLMKADFATRPYEQIAVGTSEGHVAVLDSDFEATNGFVWLNQAPLGSFAPAGNLRPPPLVSSDESGPFVGISGTALGFVAADATFASEIVPPIPRWWDKDLGSVSIFALADGLRVVGMESGNLVARRTTDGQLTNQLAMPFGWIWGAPLPLHTPQGTRVGVDWRVDGMKVGQIAVDLEAEAIVWSSDPIAIGGFYGSSAGDVDADGIDEWFSHFTNLVRRDAASGTATSSSAFAQLGYSLPMIGRFQNNVPELLLQAGGQGPKLVSSAMTLLWEATSAEAINTMAGARTTCGAATRFATAGWQSPYVRLYDGANGALLSERAYAGGEAFPSRAAAVTAGHRPGILSYLSSVEDVAGQGAALLAGSSDGYLYVIDSCTLDIRWAANLGASVGEPIVADSDGDGENEILVGTANGFLHALDTSPCLGPVLSISGRNGQTVYLSETTSVQLSWQPVANAVSYEVALVSPDDKPLWSPAYVPVAGTSTTVSLAGALAGRPYRVVVRGVTADGPGDETFSPPIVLVDTQAPSADLAITGGDSALFELTAADDLALDHYLLYLHTSDGEARLLEDDMLTGATDARTIVWTPTTDLYGTDIVFSVEAHDSAGLIAGEARSASISEDGTVMVGSSEPFEPIGQIPSAAPQADETERPTGRAKASESGCSSTGSGSSSGLWVLALAVALAGRRSRK